MSELCTKLKDDNNWQLIRQVAWINLYLFHDKLTADSYFDRIVLWCPSLALLSNLLDQAEINLDMEDKYVPCENNLRCEIITENKKWKR